MDDQLSAILSTMRRESENLLEVHLLTEKEIRRALKEANDTGRFYMIRAKFLMRSPRGHIPSNKEMYIFKKHADYVSALINELEERRSFIKGKYLSVPSLKVTLGGKTEIYSTVNKHKRRKEIKFPSIQEMKSGFKF